MKYGFFYILVVVAISGCKTTSTTDPNHSVGDLYNWTTLSPPRANALGREYYKGDVLGTIIKVTQDNVERSDTVGEINSEQQSKFSANAEIAVKKASAKLGYENVNAKTLSAKDLEITQIHDYLNNIQVNKTFIFQCMNAKEHKFEAEKKSGVTAAIDAGKFAEQFGVDVAKVEINSKPDQPSKIEVKVNNPNVCLAVKTGRFIDDNVYLTGRLDKKFVYITGYGDAYAPSFSLAMGDESNDRTPQFIGPEPSTKPIYRLVAMEGAESGKISLGYCKQGRGMGDNEFTCKELKESRAGSWNRSYFIDVFSYGDQLYKVIWLDINAKRVGDEIVVKSATMRYPQYQLVIR